MPPGDDDLPSQLEPDIQRLAKCWALDDPDAWEDLAQEARIGIIQELRENPDSPRSHLFGRAKRAILDYRRRGYSVDGKLNKNHRRRFVWSLVSLDADPDQSARGGLGDGGSLYFKPWQENPVEALAVARVTYGELRATLSGLENQYLSLKLQGYLVKESITLLGLSDKRHRGLLSSLRAKAREAFSLNGSGDPGPMSFDNLAPKI